MSVHNRMRRVGAPGAGIVWAALAGLSDQPLGIVAGGEAAEASRTSSMVCETSLHDLLFQPAEEPFDHAVLLLEVVGHEASALP